MSRDWTSWPCRAILFPVHVFFYRLTHSETSGESKSRVLSISCFERLKWCCNSSLIQSNIYALFRLIWRSCHARGQKGLGFFLHYSSGACILQARWRCRLNLCLFYLFFFNWVCCTHWAASWTQYQQRLTTTDSLAIVKLWKQHWEKEKERVTNLELDESYWKNWNSNRETGFRQV